MDEEKKEEGEDYSKEENEGYEEKPKEYSEKPSVGPSDESSSESVKRKNLRFCHAMLI